MQLLVNIDVDDLERAIHFYTSAFDLVCQRRLFAGSVAELVGAGCSLHLLAKPAGTAGAHGITQVRQYNRHWTPVHLDFTVPDIAAAVQRAVAAGAVLETQIQSCDWGRHAQLSDPFGHGFCLVEFSPQGYAAAP
ncbi:VOC family protein [Pseudomonas sp. BMS12]|uniref:VOC family protein n=1 Tax=Pseudomonas sp. BMS12 TaxID=1796033 RepID=UPI00083AA1E6|nr:VOC family protein [Pseudomonas sp. BMS12]